ncbi:MAG: hypothetical protein ACLRWM_12510 [Streptococcus sp.]
MLGSLVGLVIVVALLCLLISVGCIYRQLCRAKINEAYDTILRAEK